MTAAPTITATYIGTATVLLRIGELTVLTDPAFDAAPADYPAARPLHRTTGPALAADALPPVDLVLLSHDQHADNLDRAGREVLGRAGLVLTTPEAAARLGGRAQGLAPWETRTVTAGATTVTVTATPARHGPEGTEQATGPVTGFVIETGDRTGDKAGDRTGDRTLYVSGDTVRHDALAEIGARFALDTAFLHFGDAHFPSTGDLAFSLSAAEGAAVARTLGARRVIPLHFDSWTHLAEDPARITAAFAADPDLADRLRWLAPGKEETLD
ncbi:MBL fold metallo-hydrolase [Streptomyces sp. SKN60]|uniref:MBL fold metallo-hydrolase n=1 Tax=Streptomyces sp. SKN60 TaxID=2855506 RepID=UPI0022462BE3|nr:MBL fold metallo-hydrolase [Streptomyces sp. SKN60]MCX2180798.1 MBL fold metallo-hydrolase [Streptomyces sp. SKN60]